MTTNNVKLILGFCTILLCSLFLLQCEKDDSNLNGQVNFEMTDAPIDNTEIQGAFVTVSAIKVDGKTVDLENKQTINLLNYQNGNTKALKTTELESGSYSEVSLQLDFDKDADGNTPGCYILTTDNKKHDLNINVNNTNEIKFSVNPVVVQQNSQTDLVIDFDLRKAIKNNENSPESSYAFVTDTELKAALRAIVKTNAGTVLGNCANAPTFSERTVVYAYKKGTFSESTEMQGQGQSNVEFSNAVTSAVVASNGDFSLHFLEAGEYEIHFAAYNDNDSDGKFELSGQLETTIIGGLDLNAISVDANSSVSLTITATALIPI